MVVMMPYADSLFSCADWFRQLWAESLGKERGLDGALLRVGPTPIASRGATDQHSQLQLYAEGPDDKVYLMVTVGQRGTMLDLDGAGLEDIDAYGYLAGSSMGALIDAEFEGTRRSLLGRKRPTATLTFPRVDAAALGAFFMLFEAATAFAGPLYGVDPYDQPGVEEAKRLAFAALGRAGYEWPEGPGVETDQRYVF
jgi:glucose-6-phosphate isomerase